MTAPALAGPTSAGDDGVSPLVQADILRAAADQLGVRNPIVVGHSYGGAVAMAWGLRAPGDTAALVILGGATMPWPGGLGGWYGLTSITLGRATVVPLVTAFAPLSRAEDAIDRDLRPRSGPARLCRLCRGRPDPAPRDTVDERAAGERPAPLCGAHVRSYPRLDLPVEIVHGTARHHRAGRHPRHPAEQAAARTPNSRCSPASATCPTTPTPRPLLRRSTAPPPAPDCADADIAWHLVVPSD